MDLNTFKIITDSSCDLSQDLIEKYDLGVLPLSVELDGKEYLNYPDEREITFSAFYDKLREGASSKTSAANVDGFLQLMEEYLAAGKDVLYIGFSSGLSSTFNSGCIAAEEMQKKYPQRKVIAIDSLCASLGQGLMVVLAAQQRESGKTIEEVAEFVKKNVPNMAHWFTVNDLFFLKRGGRVSSSSAVVGSVLQIKPVMHMDNEGKLAVVSKARGRKNSIKALVEHMEQTIIQPDGHTVYISHGDCREDAEYLADLIREKFPTVGEIYINYVGPVIGSHSGPGTLALFFLATER